MMEDYYYGRMTFSEIGKKYGKSGQGVRFIIRKALQKIRVEAEKKKFNMEDFYG